MKLVDYTLMDLAIGEAQKAYLLDSVPVGAIVYDPLSAKIISKAHNDKNNLILHAEINAIIEACKLMSIDRLEGMTLYVTLEPCLMCYEAIKKSRISKIIFGTDDNIRGFTKSFHIVDKIEIYGGIREMDCSKLLQDFFQSKRTK